MLKYHTQTVALPRTPVSSTYGNDKRLEDRDNGFDSPIAFSPTDFLYHSPTSSRSFFPPLIFLLDTCRSRYETRKLLEANDMTQHQ